AAPVHPVHDGPAPQPQEEHRTELQCRADAEGHPAAGQREDEPVLGNPLHPGADDGDRVAQEEQAIVRLLQGAEGPAPHVAGGATEARHRGWVARTPARPGTSNAHPRAMLTTGPGTAA